MAQGGAIDFGELHREITTIFLILPVHELTAQPKWFRLFINLSLRGLYKSPPTSARRCRPFCSCLTNLPQLGGSKKSRPRLVAQEIIRFSLPWCCKAFRSFARTMKRNGPCSSPVPARSLRSHPKIGDGGANLETLRQSHGDGANRKQQGRIAHAASHPACPARRPHA